MLKWRRIFWVPFLFTACASPGILPGFPSAMDPAASASVVVLRNRSLVGMALVQDVFVDGFPIARLGTGQHIRFHLPPGTHSIGIADASVSIEFSAGEQYFFEINPKDWDIDAMEMELERLRPEEGLRRMESSVDITSRSGGG